MKKKKFTVFLCFLGIIGVSKGQDIEPGLQARGYLDSKDILVNHATGEFHYSVPVHVLRSGEFQLPISLDYMARGVKIDDVPEMVGYNWTLNTGGVVTRTIRGGIADEEFDFGRMWRDENDTIPLSKDTKKVNNRERDGECDIFTAVFNGQTVNFIIRLGHDGDIHAEPLERTNVRIECESIDKLNISGWTVTDENGNRYIYRQKEWTMDITREDAISFNGIRNQSYISSWHLSKIEPYNGEVIIFKYMEDMSDNQTNVNKLKYNSQYSVKYTYGKPMKEYTFNTQRYKDEFNRALAEASSYLNNHTLELQAKNQMLILADFGKWIENPFYEINQQKIYTNFRIMGQLANLKDAISCTNELITLLNNYIRMYENDPSHNTQMAVSYLRQAKLCAINCVVKEVENVSTKVVREGASQVILSPLLQSVSSVERVVEFQYERPDNDYNCKHLTKISLCDITRQKISDIELNVTQNLLQGLSFKDKTGEITGKMKFDYYSFSGIADIWGYRKQISLEEMQSYDIYSNTGIDSVGCKDRTLRTITLVDGGKITVDFESNLITDFDAILEENYKRTKKFGGIRIKSLVLDDHSGGSSDTILYRYPVPGIPVIGTFSNEDIVDYQFFLDRVQHVRGKFKGTSLLKTGNNGIYYPYVIETMPGKGSRAYLFYVSARYGSDQAPSLFWQNGLLLATATYDDHGNLKQIVKNKYYMDKRKEYGPQIKGVSFLGYFDTLSYMGYKNILPQMKAYEYYMDEEKLGAYYRDQENLEVFTQTINPYKDIYMVNFKPRTGVRLPHQYYDLYYGGKTLLKEQLEYHFESQETNRPSVVDFDAKTAGIPFRKVTYIYDNPSVSINPTRIVKTDSRGDTYTMVEKRVTEIANSADPVIGDMKKLNLLAPVIKQLTLKNGKILDETVIRYEKFRDDTLCYICPSKRYTNVRDQPETYVSSASDMSLFTRPESEYLQEESYTYRRYGKLILPGQVDSKSGSLAICYDALWKRPVLKVKGAVMHSVATADMKNLSGNSSTINNIQKYIKIYDVADRLFEGFRKLIGTSGMSMDFIKYSSSNSHRKMLSLTLKLTKIEMDVSLKDLLDSVKANNNLYLEEYLTQYEKVINSYPTFGATVDELNWFITQMKYANKTYFDETYFNYFYIAEYKPNFSGKSNLEVSIQNTSAQVNYTGIYPGGSSSNSITCERSSDYSVQVFDLDLKAGTTSVSVEAPSSIAYLALVPTGSVFEATCYNLDGTILCRFDQTGQMELNEYDAAGRLTRVKNRDGNVEKEYQYNVAKEN